MKSDETTKQSERAQMEPNSEPLIKPNGSTERNDDNPILTVSEVAAQLGKHRNTIGRWCREGVIKAGKHPSGALGIRQSQVDKMLKEFPV